MKKILIALTLFCSLPLFANPPLPNSPCTGLRGGCTPWMAQVLEDFRHQGQDILVAEGAYRGACHYLSTSYTPDHRHYSALYLLDGDQGEVYFNGTFGFFVPQSRFADWSLEKARATYANPKRRALVSHGDHSLADFSVDDVVWRYWLSQNPETLEIYLIAYWGFTHRKFCRFEAVQ